ncbi:hypothetical protein IHZ02_001255 [Salmonella enterica]|nr:hypothetical protein [Salmonella enterica]
MLLNKRKFYCLGDENEGVSLNMPVTVLYQPLSQPAKTVRKFLTGSGKDLCSFIKKSLAMLSICTRQRACLPAFVVFRNLTGCPGFVGLLLPAVIPPIFIGVHILFLVLVNLVLLTERSDRCRETLRSENDLSVIGIIRPAVVSPTPFFYVFSVPYFSGVICSVDTSSSFLTTGGEV